jgi:homocysteine S-methyltransferase
MREPFLARIDKRPVVCDGAMGTMLHAKGISLSRCFDELNVTMPQLVKEIHLAYVKAGAEVIETNTFGANKFRLGRFGLEEKVGEFNRAAVGLAREVAGDDLYVAGAVGPLGVLLEPLGATSREEARAAFRQQMAALAEAGVDLIVIETMTDLNEAHQALRAARDVGALPVVVQMTVQDDGTTATGSVPEGFARALDEWGADLIGVNCSVGPATVQETLERMAAVTAKRLAAQPNAGMPRTVDGRNLYLCSPEYMAGYARRFIQTGARLVGGCCGTTPDHIKAIKSAVRSMSPERARVAVEAITRPAQALAPVPVAERSQLAGRLERREFPVLVEVVPPKGCDPTKEVEGAQYLRERGIDAVNIPDGSGATARMSALTLAALLQQRTGLEVLLHYSARDRNVLTIQSDLLGAHALGVRNLLALTRDTPQYAAVLESDASELDAVGLVSLVNHLNRGLDVGANPLGTQTAYLVGTNVNPSAPNQEEELRRFRLKVEASADFAVTQPVFDAEKLAAFLEAARSFAPRLPLIAGIWPLTSFRNAEFMNNEVPGVSVPPAVMERMRAADSGERARQEGLKIAQETLVAIRSLVQGVQIAAPFGRYALAVEVAQALGPRPTAPASDQP